MTTKSFTNMEIVAVLKNQFGHQNNKQQNLNKNQVLNNLCLQFDQLNCNK